MRKEIVFHGVDGRDAGKLYKLTEMPAAQAEKWAMRAILALMKTGLDIPEGYEQLGMAAMAEFGLKAIAQLDWEVAEPLLDEMMSCVQIQPNPQEPRVVRPLVETDIEEISTRLKIRLEVFKLHADFLKAVAK